MNASEAKALTTKALSAEGDIKGLLEHVYQRIRQAASKGEDGVVDPLEGLRCPTTTNQRTAVWTELRRQGYTVTFYHKGDCSDLLERDWVEVSW